MLGFLSIRAPWAHSLLGVGVPEGWDAKTVENRSWQPEERQGRIGVHVSKRADADGLAILERDLLPIEVQDLGHVIGSVMLRECHPAGSLACREWRCYENPWAFWPTVDTPRIVHWIVGEPRRLITPFAVRGALQLWPGTPSDRHRLETGEIYS